MALISHFRGVLSHLITMSAKYKSLIVFTTCELSSFNAYCKAVFSKENTLFNEHDFMCYLSSAFIVPQYSAY